MAIKDALVDPLPQPEVLLCVFFVYSVAIHSDSAAAAEQALRDALPKPAPSRYRKALKRSFRDNVGIVRWSPLQGCFWMGQGQKPKKLNRVHPSHVPEALVPLVRHEEPDQDLTDTNTASEPKRP